MKNYAGKRARIFKKIAFNCWIDKRRSYYSLVRFLMGSYMPLFIRYSSMSFASFVFEYRKSLIRNLNYEA